MLACIETGACRLCEHTLFVSVHCSGSALFLPLSLHVHERLVFLEPWRRLGVGWLTIAGLRAGLAGRVSGIGSSFVIIEYHSSCATVRLSGHTSMSALNSQHDRRSSRSQDVITGFRHTIKMGDSFSQPSSPEKVPLLLITRLVCTSRPHKTTQ